MMESAFGLQDRKPGSGLAEGTSRVGARRDGLRRRDRSAYAPWLRGTP